MKYEMDLGAFAKDLLSSCTETKWNKELLDGWREVAVTENVNELYNTSDVECVYEE